MVSWMHGSCLYGSADNLAESRGLPPKSIVQAAEEVIRSLACQGKHGVRPALLAACTLIVRLLLRTYILLRTYVLLPTVFLQLSTTMLSPDASTRNWLAGVAPRSGGMSREVQMLESHYYLPAESLWPNEFDGKIPWIYPTRVSTQTCTDCRHRHTLIPVPSQEP